VADDSTYRQTGGGMNELRSVDELWGPGVWYVATPYTDYPLGRDTAHHYAQRIGAALAGHDVHCFVPAAWGHAIAECADIDPCDTAFWDRFCAPFVHLARGMLIVRLTAWDKSRGISLERAYFTDAGKPVLACDPELLLGYRIERRPQPSVELAA
jgi:hypothetical protein